MDPRLNCYLNSAYNRNIDDFEDTVENELHRSYSSSTENETFVDELPEERNLWYSREDINRVAACNRSRINHPSQYPQRLPPYGYRTSSVDAPFRWERCTDQLTSTPKKQLRTMSMRNPHRRETAIRRNRSLSAPRSRKYVAAAAAFAESNWACPEPLRRSKSSLSIRQRYEDPMYNIIQSTPTSPTRYQRYLRSPDTLVGMPLLTSPIAPLHRQPQYLRRPYDANASFSSTRPLVSRNMAVISPTIYTSKKEEDSFEEDHSKAFTIAADRSPCSSKSNSWMNMKRQTMPTCTLRFSGFTLLVSGTLSCLLCFHLISIRGRSCELTVSLLSGFITMCLGFTCVWIQRWPWIPHRNYVSGYVVLSLFSLLQSATLWILDKHHPSMQQDLIDIMRGALYGLTSLTMSVAVLGIWVSCCCEHPPRDSRVAHGVSSISV